MSWPALPDRAVQFRRRKLELQADYSDMGVFWKWPAPVYYVNPGPSKGNSRLPAGRLKSLKVFVSECIVFIVKGFSYPECHGSNICMKMF